MGPATWLAITAEGDQVNQVTLRSITYSAGKANDPAGRASVRGPALLLQPARISTRLFPC
jgi:hypothetical protein